MRHIWLIHMWDMSHSYATWLIYTLDMTHASFIHDSWLIHTQLIHTWLIHTCDVTLDSFIHDSLIYGSFIHVTRPMTHSYVRYAPFGQFTCATSHDSSICVPWLIYLCAMTHLFVCHDSSICVPWLIYMCAMGCGTCKLVMWLMWHTCMVMAHTYEWVTSHIRVCYVKNMCD